MKTILKPTLTLVYIFVACFTFFIFSCKKAEFNNDPKVDYSTMEKAKAFIAKQMEKEGGIPEIFVRNQKVNTMWVNSQHKPLTQQQMQSNFTSQCNYDLPAYCNLVQYSRVFRCTNVDSLSGYLLQFEYELSWNNNVVQNDGFNNLTEGNIEIVSDVTNNIVQTLTLTDVQIVDAGPDPNPSFPNNHIFKVKFFSSSSQLVPRGYINGDVTGTYTVKLSANFVTDCKQGGGPYYLWLLPVTTYGYTGYSGNNPCKRNEKGWVTPAGSGGTDTNYLIIAGYNVLGWNTCGYNSNFIETDLQEVEYDVDGDNNWLPMINFTALSLPITGKQYIRRDDFAKTGILPSGDHVIGVRYRNWKYNSTQTGWPIPSTLIACHSIGDTINTVNSYSTYAYEYWIAVNIP